VSWEGWQQNLVLCLKNHPAFWCGSPNAKYSEGVFPQLPWLSHYPLPVEYVLCERDNATRTGWQFSTWIWKQREFVCAFVTAIKNGEVLSECMHLHLPVFSGVFAAVLLFKCPIYALYYILIFYA